MWPHLGTVTEGLSAFRKCVLEGRTNSGKHNYRCCDGLAMAVIYTATLLLAQSLQQDGREQWKDKNIAINAVHEVKNGGKKKAKAITYHLPPADQCPASLQVAASLEPHPSFIAEYDIIWCGIFLQSVQVSRPGCVPSHPFAQPQLTAGVVEWETEKAQKLCASTAQQQVKLCVINTVLVGDLKHSTFQVAEKKIKSIQPNPVHRSTYPIVNLRLSPCISVQHLLRVVTSFCISVLAVEQPVLETTYLMCPQGMHFSGLLWVVMMYSMNVCYRVRIKCM